jgi:hypothetical protein
MRPPPYFSEATTITRNACYIRKRHGSTTATDDATTLWIASIVNKRASEDPGDDLGDHVPGQGRIGTVFMLYSRHAHPKRGSYFISVGR